MFDIDKIDFSENNRQKLSKESRATITLKQPIDFDTLLGIIQHKQRTLLNVGVREEQLNG